MGGQPAGDGCGEPTTGGFMVQTLTHSHSHTHDQAADWSASAVTGSDRWPGLVAVITEQHAAANHGLKEKTRREATVYCVISILFFDIKGFLPKTTNGAQA